MLHTISAHLEGRAIFSPSHYTRCGTDHSIGKHGNNLRVPYFVLVQR
jgi:hypothetical protein